VKTAAKAKNQTSGSAWEVVKRGKVVKVRTSAKSRAVIAKTADRYSELLRRLAKR
jgi:hypothetical protein